MQRPPYTDCHSFIGMLAKCLMVAAVAGCAAKTSAPPSIISNDRDAIKRNLTSLGSRVTADIPEGLYLTLRNTHIEIRETGGVIEGSPQTRQDFDDFMKANDAIANVFLAADEFEQFKKWLRNSMTGSSRIPQQADYTKFKLTLSRVPLHAAFSLNEQADSK
jgi:hypothetical protein